MPDQQVPLYATDLARLLGISSTAVYKAHKLGRLSPITYDKKKNPMFDVSTARVVFNRLTGNGQDRLPDITSQTREISGAVRVNVDLATLKRAREAQKVKLGGIELREKEGQLIDRDMTVRQWTAHCAMAKSRLMGLPAKLRSQIPKLTVQDIELIGRELRIILSDLAAWKPGEDFDFEDAGLARASGTNDRDCIGTA